MLAPLVMFYFALVSFFSFGLNYSESPASKISLQANATADFFIKYHDAVLAFCEINQSRCANDANPIQAEIALSDEASKSELIKASAINSCKVSDRIFVFSSPKGGYIPSNYAYQNELAKHLTAKLAQRESVVYVGKNVGFDRDLFRCGISLTSYHTILVMK